MIETMNSNRKAITSEIASLVFYMKGGLDFNDAYLLSAEQRVIMSKVIEKHFKAMNGDKNGGNLIG